MLSILSTLLVPVSLALSDADPGECTRPLTAPAAGRYLIAARNMQDPRFRQTVILLLEHNESGSIGVIINRDTGIALEKALPKQPRLAGRNQTISNGGPVAKRVVIFLVRHTELPPESAPVMQDVYYSASQMTLEKLLSQSKTAEQLRLFSGHAGWAAGQLQEELGHGAWHVISARVEPVFGKPDPGLWSRLIRCVPGPGLQVRQAVPLMLAR